MVETTLEIIQVASLLAATINQLFIFDSDFYIFLIRRKDPYTFCGTSFSLCP